MTHTLTLTDQQLSNLSQILVATRIHPLMSAPLKKSSNELLDMVITTQQQKQSLFSLMPA